MHNNQDLPVVMSTAASVEECFVIDVFSMLKALKSDWSVKVTLSNQTTFFEYFVSVFCIQVYR